MASSLPQRTPPLKRAETSAPAVVTPRMLFVCYLSRVVWSSTSRRTRRKRSEDVTTLKLNRNFSTVETVGADLRVGPVPKAHTQVRPYRIAPICKSAIDRAAGRQFQHQAVNRVRVRARARFPLRSGRRLRGRTSRLRRGVSPPDLPRTRSRPCVGRGRLLEGARRYRFSRSRIPATIPHMFPKARRNVQA